MFPVSQLSGKKIVIDVSIYLYKYIAENSLIENMYLMLSIFRYYQIIPIFIFDGKPPHEKKELLQKRREDKKTAEQEYQQLKKKLTLDSEHIEEYEKQDIQNQMDLLKKQFIFLNKETIEEVKQLMRAYGATYYDAPGEADELCAALVIKNKAWACLSEDMDLFVYGCPRVLRYFSLLNHTVILYDLVKILDHLDMNQNELSEICVLSGTDYNQNMESKQNNTLYNSMALFKKYRNKKETPNQNFYDWLNKNTDFVNDFELLNSIKSMFECNSSKLKLFDDVRFANGPIIKEDIREILKRDGFLF
jgi:5'-3' exonuclease